MQKNSLTFILVILFQVAGTRVEVGVVVTIRAIVVGMEATVVTITMVAIVVMGATEVDMELETKDMITHHGDMISQDMEDTAVMEPEVY